METVAVTGTSGLVGTAVAKALEAAGWRVRGADLRPGRRTSVVGDLRSESVRRELVRQADVVVHAAALHAPHVGLVDDAEFRAVNVGATAALLDDAKIAGVRRFVYISSTSVYGYALVPSTAAAVWVDEQLVPRPRDIYDETKLAAERLVAESGLTSVTLRIARCFPEAPPVMAVRLLHRSVRLADVAAAVVSAVTHDDVTGTFNIAGNYPFTRDDCPALFHDAAAVIASRAPEIAAAFHERGWALPERIDRVYDSGAAAAWYRPAQVVPHGPGPYQTPDQRRFP